MTTEDYNKTNWTNNKVVNQIRNELDAIKMTKLSLSTRIAIERAKAKLEVLNTLTAQTY